VPQRPLSGGYIIDSLNTG
jgi:fumarate hydratase subunit beta